MKRPGFLLLAAVALARLAVAQPSDPWSVLERVRHRLEVTEPQQWEFVQTFLAAGFRQAERESGRLALDLPRCVRWDYDDPYPKSYLLCGRQLHAWSADEGTGQVYVLEERQPGLDLLLLDVGSPAKSYRAELVGEGEIRLLPHPGSSAGALLQEAELSTSAGDPGLTRVRYRDAEGNLTTFDFGAVAPVPDGTVFSLPSGVTWEAGGSQ